MNNNESSSPKSSPTPFSEGQKLAGCYDLKRRIVGATATEVWLAHDEVLGKDVSLHFIPNQLVGDAAAMTELRQEVKRTRQLIHPNILRVYDLVEDADWAAISMDAFEGQSLAVQLAERKGKALDPAAIQPWLDQLCQTLDDAHKVNIVHRDISPENIFVTGEGKLIVTNFGISRCLADAIARISGKQDPHLARRSPQQLEGATATRADDVYAVGALLFQSLTGRETFMGDDVPAQIRQTPAPTIATVWAKDAPPVSAVWENVISACLQKAPEARPQSLLEVSRQVAGGSTQKAITSAPAVTTEKKKPVVENPVPVAAKLVSEPAKSISASQTKGKSETAKPTEPAGPAPKLFAPDAYPILPSTEKSRFPVGFAVAASLIVIGSLGYYFNGLNKDGQTIEPTAGLAPTEQPEGLELRSVNNKIETPVAAPIPAEIKAEPASVETKAEVAEPAPASPTAPAPEPAMLLVAAAPAKAAAATPVPAAAPVAMGDEDKAVAEKIAALEKAKQDAKAAEKAREEMLKQQRQADAAVVEAQKALDQKTKALSPAKKAADEVLAQLKKLEDEQKAADLAAEQARQLAAEKARVAEAAKKAIADLESKNKEKLAAQSKAAGEIETVQKALAEKQQAVAGIAKAATDGEAERARLAAAIKQNEQDVEQARTAAAEARRLREEAEAERRKLGQELAEMQKMMEKKKAEIEERLKKLEAPGAKPSSETPPAPEVKPAEKQLPPVPAPKPTSLTPPTPAPAPVAVVPPPATPMPAVPAPVIPVAVPAEPKPAAVAPVPTQLAMKTDPEKLAVPTTPSGAKPPAAAASNENSLGMRFVPVGDVEFSIWQTRVKDFEVFAKAVNLKSTAWRGPGFKQGPDHPVVNVTWLESVAFCKWLTDLEHKDGSLPANQFYRLPFDLEWSKAVSLPEEPGKTPEARDMGVADVFPWGTQWPPPPQSGNYTGEETGSEVAIKGYDDGFAWTSPVGSFPPNKFGLYDMGGNVWQWCMDAWNNDSKAKVLRGASWYNGALKLSLLSSCRVHASPDSSTDNYGFRIVRASDSAKAGKR